MVSSSTGLSPPSSFVGVEVGGFVGVEVGVFVGVFVGIFVGVFVRLKWALKVLLH